MLRLSHLFIILIIMSTVLFAFNIYMVMPRHNNQEPAIPYLGGMQSNERCYQYILPFGHNPIVNTDTQDMAFQMWVNVESYPDEISTLYDNGNIRLDIDAKGWIYLYDSKGLITNITSTNVYSLKITSPIIYRYIWTYIAVVIRRSFGIGYLYSQIIWRFSILF